MRRTVLCRWTLTQGISFFFFTLRYYVFMQFKESRWDVKTRKEILEKGDLVCAKVL